MSENTPKSDDLNRGITAIKKALKTAPSQPGVYRMIDKNDDILYVGKAKDITKRVSSYTRANALNNRLMKMVSRTVSMVFVTTTTESEALLLEASLIKRYSPPFNILLKDDKSFPYILLRTDHQWPQITKHRGARKHKGHYFGPFASVNAVNKTLNILQKVFQLRSCTDNTLETRSRACLLHQIKRCSAPCVDKVSDSDYKDMVNETRLFLDGKDSSIQKKFADAMQQASSVMDYEKAAIFRDRLQALTQVQSHQSMVNAMIDEADIVAAYSVGGKTCVQMFFFRAGQNWGHRAYFPNHDKEDDTGVVLNAFLAQFYDNKPVPKQILVSHLSDETDLLAEALSERAEKKITITQPQRGKKAELIQEATRNAKEALERKLADSTSQKRLLDGLADILNLEDSPNRIEVYDNSHIQGTNAVGGMIVAGPDGFMKNQYRKFNIKNEDLTPGDDFGMMQEVLTRRFKRLLSEDEDKSRGHWPDILLIDGGKGQLSSVHEVLDDMGVEGVLTVAISKGPDRNAGREQFHIRGRKTFMLPINDPVLYYLQRLRDEAHRFAIGTHRAKRSKDIHKSPLDGIPGIGPKRKKALLNHFGSAKAVQGAHKRDIEAVDGISKAIAEQIYDYFQQT